MSTSLSTISWLPEDLTGKATTNFIQNEQHRSQTTGSVSRFVIIPAQGAFYDTENLKVVYHSGTKESVLLRDNDYRLVGVDFGRTKVSSAKGGVYHFILITTVFSQDPNSYITIDYQAFGGYMSYEAYTSLLNAIAEMEALITTDGIITADNIADNPTIRKLMLQLQAVCNRLQYTPSVKYLMPSSYDSTLNWKTIAVSNRQYDGYIDNDDPSTLKGSVVFTVFSDVATFKVALQYDLTPTQDNIAYAHKCTLKTDVMYQSIVQHNPATTAGDGPFFEDGLVFIPKFRVVYDTAADNSKVYIQMAIVSNMERNFNLVITDSTDLSMDDLAGEYVLTEDTVFVEGKTYYTRTGSDNYYRYEKAEVTVGATVPSNTYYNLTDINLIHNTSIFCRFVLLERSASADVPEPPEEDTTNYSNACLAIKDGYKIWEGNVNLAFIEDVSYYPPEISEEYNVPDQLMPRTTPDGYLATGYVPGSCIEPYSVSKFVVEVYDRWARKLIKAAGYAAPNDPFSVLTTDPIASSGTVIYFPEDFGSVSLKLIADGNECKLCVYAKSGKSSKVNKRFDLRTIYIA